MTVTNIWVGAVTDDAFTVVAKTDATSARLAVSTSVAMTSPVYFGPATPTAQDIVTITTSGLLPVTQYFYALEEDGVLDTTKPGRCRTAPAAGAHASFTFASSSCADGVLAPYPTAGQPISNHQVFDIIRGHNPDFFVHTGDLHYHNIATNDQALFRSAFDDVLAAPKQAQLYREVPLVYVWDDHDFGPNNSDSTSPSRDAACLTYRERVPHYPLVEGAGANPIYHSFTWGRMLFIVTDARSERDPDTDPNVPGKTMLGATQLAWFLNLLETTTAPAICWVNSTPWLADSTVVDSWGLYTTERDTVAAAINANVAGRIFMVTGDLHAMAFDDGTNNAWGGFPVWVLSAMDGNPQVRGGPYSGGSSIGQNRWGLFTVEDHTTGFRITGDLYAGNALWQSQTFEIGTVPPPGERFVGLLT